MPSMPFDRKDVTLAAAIAAAAGFWIFWQSRGYLPARHSQPRRFKAPVCTADWSWQISQISKTVVHQRRCPANWKVADGQRFRHQAESGLHFAWTWSTAHRGEGSLERATLWNPVLLCRTCGGEKWTECLVVLGQRPSIGGVLTKRTRHENCGNPGLLSRVHTAANANHGKVSTSRTVLCVVCLWVWATCPGELDVWSWDIYQWVGKIH